MARIKASEAERESSVDKSEKILQGAMQEFLAHGYAGASMDRVASRAGVSKATVYSYFQDKEGLFKTLVEQMAAKRFQSVFGKQPPEGDASVVLPKLARTALAQMIEDKEHRAFMRVIFGESGRFPELAQVCVRCLAKPAIETVTQYLTAHPELNLPDPEATAWILIGTLISFMNIQEMLQGKEIIPIESDRLIESLTYLITGAANPKS
ncbi:TetR/AcrR family transcriptional regulator [Microseira sp. BLCC-F43]|jgi:AcrR family transcriptional regulator|uniref:TetR/AcrR family transcriptional regulator n=1 Tax=Microseira sp. BLCC-F43 TaxID=3153602 RepID=UPI0035BA46D6